MLYQFLLGFHISAGFTALVTGLIAMLAVKGKKVHLNSGKIYFWTMTITCLSAIAMSLMKPNPFLFVIAILSYFSVAIGYRALYLKKIYTGLIKPSGIDYTIALLPLVLIVLMHSWVYVLEISQRGMEYVNLGLSIYVAANGLIWLRSFNVRRDEKQYWMIAHLQGMGGGYIATATAFLVTNIQFLPPLVVWITPSVIGATIIAYTTRKYTIRFKAGKANGGE